MLSNSDNAWLQEDIDAIVNAWEIQRPDFDAAPLAIFTRLLRLSWHIDKMRREVFARHNLETWEFEMLAALRREGAPHRLTPKRLMGETMVSSGTITNRLDRMETHGLVERRPDLNDGRVVQVFATEKGIDRADQAMADLLEVQRDLLSSFSVEEFHHAKKFLSQLLDQFEGHEEVGA